MFEVAKEKWGLTNLPNPFRGLKIKGSSYRRTRRLIAGELAALDKASKDCMGQPKSNVRKTLDTTGICCFLGSANVRYGSDTVMRPSLGPLCYR